LHQTLAQVYRDWSYTEPLPEINWIRTVGSSTVAQSVPLKLTEGEEILENYYHSFIAG
jgi:hypothetical protein